MAGFDKTIKTSRKENQSHIVTKVDFDSERTIINLIKKRFPNHNIVAEETGFYFQGSQYTWIIDPIDGTSNYVSHLPWFGTMIGVLKDWQPIKAGISLSFYKKIYYAEKGRGTFCNDKKIGVTKEKDLSDVLVGYSLDYSEEPRKTEKEVQIIRLLVKSVRNLRATNSVFDFCAVAEGQYGGFLIQTNGIWDVAAPYLIIKEAGGEFTDILGRDINFKSDKNNYLRNFTILTASKTLHPKLLKVVKKVMKNE